MPPHPTSWRGWLAGAAALLLAFTTFGTSAAGGPITRGQASLHDRAPAPCLASLPAGPLTGLSERRADPDTRDGPGRAALIHRRPDPRPHARSSHPRRTTRAAARRRRPRDAAPRGPPA